MIGWKQVTLALLGSYPAQKLDEDSLGAFVYELESRKITPEEALAAVRGYQSQYPPSAGTIAGLVDTHRQGPPPTWRTAYTIIARHVNLLPYHNPKDGWQDFILALADKHESVARFAVALGPMGVRGMPDPNYSQDRDGSFELSRLEREWRETTEEWKADPRRGLALEQAQPQQIGGWQGLLDDWNPDDL